TINPSTQKQWVTLYGPNGNGTGGLGGWITYSGSAAQIPWQITTGSVVVVNRGQPDEETVVVTNVDTTNPAAPRFEAIYQRDHNTNPQAPASINFTIPGNPGPRPGWSPYDAYENLVVPYWEYLGQG